MNIEILKRKYLQCKKNNRYQEVDKNIYKIYFRSSNEDLSKSQEEILSGNLFWSLAALDSSATQLLDGLSIKRLGLRPRSRVCSENLIFSKKILNEMEYEIIRNIRDTRNKAAYDALFRNDLEKDKIVSLISSFEKIFIKFGGGDDQ
ncbi:hypothetical protein CMI38_03615 [Candidatus Pacearchaeota archaeon]|jgi:hypothetical protein|nr:hypothetical protein [Candidatus Pacearchaeota archaeon]|tara:strand:- start:1201 stop:1641 length:441 start_codon:yes stop_codon:yes gene_type:complete